MPSPTPFAEYLTSMLERRGAAASLAAQSGVPQSHISRMMSGAILPTPEVLSKLIAPMTESDRSALVQEYLRLHLPDNADRVRILINDEEGPRDRLQRAIDLLDGKVREDLAALVEAVNRSPDQGHKALKAMSAWFKVAESPVSYEASCASDLPLAADNAGTYGSDGSEGSPKPRKG